MLAPECSRHHSGPISPQAPGKSRISQSENSRQAGLEKCTTPWQPVDGPITLNTSALVIAEVHGWFLRRYDRQRAIQFLAFVEALPALNIRPFDQGELIKAGRFVKKFANQNLTLADAHGLAIMQELRVGSCWSTDRHLSLTGVPLVI